MKETIIRAMAAFGVVFVLGYSLLIAGSLLQGVIASLLILLLLELRRRNNILKQNGQPSLEND